MATDVAMDDMDIDFDEDPEMARLQAEADAFQKAHDERRASDAMNEAEELPEEGEYDGNAPAPNKVHIRGVDKLNTHHIRQFAEEHYSLSSYQKVEWIDDTSVNIVYETELAAAEALGAFSAEEVSDPLQLRDAKRLFTHPDTTLQVRQATVSDVKTANAKERSRFYLHNPEWDPDNRIRKRRRPDYYGGYPSYKYPKREWEDDQNERREREISFTEDMYDERPKEVDTGRRGSSYSDGEYGRRRVNYGEDEDLMPRPTNARPRERSASPRRSADLMSRPTNGRYRERSASPRRGITFASRIAAKYRRRSPSPRRREDLMSYTTNARFHERSLSPRRDSDGDGRYGFNEQYPRRRTPRPRSRTPPGLRAGRNNSVVRDDYRPELFPARPPPSTLTNGAYPTASAFRTPGRQSSSSSNIELFPEKVNNSAHRRTGAINLHHDQIVDAFGKYSISDTRADERYTYDNAGLRPEYDDRGRYERHERGGGDLFSRTNGGPTSSSDSRYDGRLRDLSPVPRRVPDDAGFNIKGADAGFSILGASNRREKQEERRLATELFPDHRVGGDGQRGNDGRELFPGGASFKGQSGQRSGGQPRVQASDYY